MIIKIGFLLNWVELSKIVKSNDCLSNIKKKQDLRTFLKVFLKTTYQNYGLLGLLLWVVIII